MDVHVIHFALDTNDLVDIILKCMWKAGITLQIQWNLLIRTLEYKNTCIIHTLNNYGPKWCFII